MKFSLHYLILPGLLIFISLSANGQLWDVTYSIEMPEPVANNAVVEGRIDDQTFVYSFGGIDKTKTHSGIHLKSWRLDLLNNQWDSIPNIPDKMGKIAAGASRIGDIIYVIGGYHVFPNGNEVSSSKTHRFNITTNDWMENGTDIPKAIDDHVQAVWKDSLIYIITGWSNTTNVPDVQIYNPKVDSWESGTTLPNNNNFKSFGASGTILGDTIYYFGGAAFASNFPCQNILRKGAINPENPSEISWTFSVPDGTIKGYRAACTAINNEIHWLGGSDITYNYNGIAYNGSGGVPLINRDLYFSIDQQEQWSNEVYDFIPMDLRGIANINDTVRYIVGGMGQNQDVSASVLKLVYNNVNTTTNEEKERQISIFPNPVKDLLNISLDVPQNTIKSLQIINIAGEAIESIDLYNSTIDVTNLPAGLYYLLIQTTTSMIQKPFVKTK